jgi:cobalt-zinc-cadmium efflux system protein
MADALHNTNDAAALLIAYVARRVSRRAADRIYTFGYRRAELIGAMIQLTALIVVGLYLLYEACARLIAPEPIQGIWVMAASGVALVVDIATAWFLWGMAKGSLNAKAAFLHNLTDAVASVAVLLGGAAIYWLDWAWVDPTLTIAIAGYILYMSVGLLRKTSHILMEGAPADIDMDDIETAVQQVVGVIGLHHIHVWGLDENHRAMEAHVVLDSDRADHGRIRRDIKSALKSRFDIAHCTLELEAPSERESCADTC